jgi:oligopeptide/dipeptide ABC transporter ATP-binding protein
LLAARGLTKDVVLRRAGRRRDAAVVSAVAGVDLRLDRGASLGVVGPTGCGKTTLARLLVHLEVPTAGEVRFDGCELGSLSGAALRRLRRRMQVVFQDPYDAMNPRLEVAELLAEPLRVQGLDDGGGSLVRRAMVRVGLDDRWGVRRPRDLPIEVAQRVALARAMVLGPELLVMDEFLAVLDDGGRDELVGVIARVAQDSGLSIVAFAHHPDALPRVDHLAIMYLGTLVEVGPPGRLRRRPAHPCTAELMGSGRGSSSAELPSPVDPPSGCRARTRCSRADDRCAVEVPALRPIGPEHQVACHHPLSAPAGASAGSASDG